VDLAIRRGEYVAIVGQNGGGKSTLVKHFLHLLEPTRGRVLVEGQRTTDLEVSALARRIGYVGQNPDHQIFCDSVEDEVSFALKLLKFPPAEIRERVDEALEAMSLADVADRHPLSLGRGDRSRVVMAAVLALRPETLIFDEPTTGQDAEGARAILDLTRRVHETGKTVVIITHHLYLLPGYAERLVVMEAGRVLLDRTLRDGFYEPEVLARTSLTPPQTVRFALSLEYLRAAGARPLSAEEFAACLAPVEETVP
jgi:energy-coupling factor transport system ATP-binding protein